MRAIFVARRRCCKEKIWQFHFRAPNPPRVRTQSGPPDDDSLDHDGRGEVSLELVRGKKRCNPFRDTDLSFLLERRLQVDTLILAGINTTSCVLCCGFETTNRDYRVVIAEDAAASMDGEDMHRFALSLMPATLEWVLGSDAIIAAFRILWPEQSR